MSRLPAVFATGLILALAAGAAVIQRLPTQPPEAARLTSWPEPAQMPGFGDNGALGPAEISDLTEYVLALTGSPRDEAAVVRAAPLYQTHCASCHGLGGEGAEMLGTPDLTRRQFRNVTGPEDIRMQIWHGADGRGPMREAQGVQRAPRG